MNTTKRTGDHVAGIGRNGHPWPSRPTGVVTMVWRNRDGEHVRVQWDGCCVEDDMDPSELVSVAS
jgi:hypothetical protein